MQNINVSLFKIRIIKDPLAFIRYKSTNSFGLIKRGFILEKFITDRDKRKNWHFNILNHKPKARHLFENVHKPFRRQNVLNTLLIRNITDVISTGDVSPEIMGYGIEIAGVQVSPCCKILNVFWQVPVGKSESSVNLNELLNRVAPRIRAELISRNIMGRVPFIYFLRDVTNARIAAFEEAFKNMDLKSDTDSSIVADDEFTKNIYSFRTSKVNKKDQVPKIEDGKVSPQGPQKPRDMKSDIFGLNHEIMTEKIMALKKKSKNPHQQSAVISPESLKEGDLFSNIPGICFQADVPRDKILKQFQSVIRKRMKKTEIIINQSENDCLNMEATDDANNDLECNSYLDDFIEEDISENSKN